MKKRLLLMLLTLCLIVTLFAGASAQNNTTINSELETLGVKKVSSVPSGIKPIILKNEKELLNFINSLKLEKSNTISEKVIETRDTTDTIEVSTYQGVGYGNGKINLFATIHRWRDGSFGAITDVTNKYTSFTGFTYSFDWRESHPPQHTIATDQLSCHVWVNGELDYYFLVSGLLRIYTEPVRLDINYSIN